MSTLYHESFIIINYYNNFEFNFPPCHFSSNFTSCGFMSPQFQPYTYIYTYISHYWRRKWQPTPIFLPGKSRAWRSLVGCSPWGLKESDTTERLHFTHFTHFIVYHWRRKWQSTPVFFLGESHGQRSLVGRGQWGRRESDTTEVTVNACTHISH